MRCSALFLLLIFFGAFVNKSEEPAPVSSNAEDFCTIFFRIVKSSVEQNFDNLKGKSLGSVRKGNNIIEKWESVENMPGMTNGLITKSFATSFSTVLFTTTELNDSIKNEYERYGFELKDCLSPSWSVRENEVPGIYKKISVGRKDPNEMLKFPNIILEVESNGSNFNLVFKVIK